MPKFSRADGQCNAAIKTRLEQLLPAEQVRIQLQAKMLSTEIKGLGYTSALEIIFKLGNLLEREHNA